MTPRLLRDGPLARAAAIDALRAGGIVALPTDTVYGLAVALETPGGLERLFELKSRPPDKGIAVLCADADQARALADFGPAAEALAAACWPGGLTLVLPVAEGVHLPATLTAGGNVVGLRVPAHDAPRVVAAALGPLPTTSANLSGRPEAPDAATVAAQLGAGLALIVDAGPAPGGAASTVVLAEGATAHVLRDGAIPFERITAILAGAGLPGPAGVGR
jgi:L-threonylcarbamoyladenylate synthase